MPSMSFSFARDVRRMIKGEPPSRLLIDIDHFKLLKGKFSGTAVGEPGA